MAKKRKKIVAKSKLEQKRSALRQQRETQQKELADLAIELKQLDQKEFEITA